MKLEIQADRAAKFILVSCDIKEELNESSISGESISTKGPKADRFKRRYLRGLNSQGTNWTEDEVWEMLEDQARQALDIGTNNFFNSKGSSSMSEEDFCTLEKAHRKQLDETELIFETMDPKETCKFTFQLRSWSLSPEWSKDGRCDLSRNPDTNPESAVQ